MKEILSIEREIVIDEGEPAADFARYMAEDRARIDAFDRGEWFMVGIRAVAHLKINGIMQDIESPGLWGIESDSGESYFNEVYNDELNTLGDMLYELGFGGSDILEHAPGLCTDDPVDA